MGKRGRQRARSGTSGVPGPGAPGLTAPTSEYADDAAGVLVLRGALSPATRREYTEVLHGGLNQDDALARAAELLFERLAVSWTIAEIATEKPRELLARYRVASAAERTFVRQALRAHVAENFPELEAP